MPDVVTMTDGVLDKPTPAGTLAWRMCACVPIFLCLMHIKAESVFIALCVLLGIWLTASVRTFVLCVCFQHSYNSTVILQDGGKRYERTED